MPKLKFLVVEDDLFYQTYMNDLLAETDVDIVNASDGEAGLAMAIAERPDLIITDIEIPKIQGFVLFKALRERPDTKDIPVIMMSGKVEKALLDRHSKLNIHADGYLVKPFSGQVLIDMIRDVVGKDFGFSEVVIASDGEDTVDHPDPADANGAPEISQFPVEDSEVREREEELTVLVVDDSRYICDITVDFLKELGVRAETASDGETGFKLASDLLPALVLLDVQMPNLNGFVVCEMLRKQEETKNIPIVLMSAVVDDESFQRHSKLRYHADAYLQKPFMKSELHELVRRFTYLGQSAAEDVESKTGFFIPLEGDGSGVTAGSAAGAIDPKLVEELKQARSELEEKVALESQLIVEMEGVKKNKEQLEAELFDLRKTVEGKESGLQDKLTLVTHRFEETRKELERLAEENRKLEVTLKEISSDEKGTEEFETLEEKLRDTQKELSDRVNENLELTDKLKEAESNVELKGQLTEFGARLEDANAQALEMENRNKLLEEEIKHLKEEKSLDAASEIGDDGREDFQKQIEGLKRDLTAATAAKKEIEDQAKSLLENRGNTDEVTILKGDLEKTRKENQEFVSRIAEAEAKVKWLDELQSELEKVRSESKELRIQLDAAPEDTNAELTTLKDKLSAALNRTQSLEKEIDSMSSTQEEMEEVRSRNVEMEQLNEELKKRRRRAESLPPMRPSHVWIWRVDWQARLKRGRCSYVNWRKSNINSTKVRGPLAGSWTWKTGSRQKRSCVSVPTMRL